MYSQTDRPSAWRRLHRVVTDVADRTDPLVDVVGNLSAGSIQTEAS